MAARPAAICRRLQPISSAAACSFLVSTEITGRPAAICSDHPDVDVLELGVAIGVACAFVCLAIDLPRVAEPFLKELGDRIGADLVAVRTQSIGELGGALRHPLHGPFRIAHRRWLDEALKVRNECRVDICYGLPTATFTSHATFRQVRLLQPHRNHA
jgi:hypothetical protein